jgi:heme-degrading monooxygenase HmoA
VVIVLFRARVRDGIDVAEYERTFERMVGLASEMPGFIDIEGYSAADGNGELAVVRFESVETLLAWRNHPEHLATQQRGREEFFASYQITVSEQIREYAFSDSDVR